MIEDVIYEKLSGSNSAAPLQEGTAWVNPCQKNSYADIQQYIQIMETTRENPAYRILVSKRGIVGKLIVFVKKVIRKLLKWYIEPVTNQQTEFNNAVTPSISRLVELSLHSQMQLEHMREELQELRTVFSENAGALEQVNRKLNCIEEIDPTIFQVENKSFFDKMTTAQSGEDSILAYIFMVLGYKPEDVTYLDLGANHAKELSNTYYFYKKGAKGVLVEANPQLIPELKLLRSRDVVLNCCVTDTDDEEVEFYITSGDGLSSKDSAAVDQALTINDKIRLTDKIRIKTISVNTIIQQFMKETPLLLNVDIEGCDMEVLQSLDYTQYRPLVIVVETVPYATSLVVESKDEEIISFLKEKGYAEYAFTGINSIFIDKNQLK